ELPLRGGEHRLRRLERCDQHPRGGVDQHEQHRERDEDQRHLAGEAQAQPPPDREGAHSPSSLSSRSALARRSIRPNTVMIVALTTPVAEEKPSRPSTNALM